MKMLDFTLCGLLALAGLAHLGGTFAGYQPGTEVFVWSVSATAFTFTIVFLHFLRIQRPDDRPVAAGAAVTTIVWIAIALSFGGAVGNVVDPRALTHVVISLALLATTARGWATSRSRLKAA